MTDTRDAVQAQYEAWVYPLPIDDLSDGDFYPADDPTLMRRKLWPRKVEPETLDILVAGCGTNQAALYAFSNRDCHVVGIDLSEASLDHERSLKDKHQLDNLELHQLPVEHVHDLKQSFDFISSTGVLHHLPDPDHGLRSLRDALAPHGVMSLMLYGRYGRLGVYMLQETLRMLGAEQNADGLEMVRHVLDTIPPWHVAQSYVRQGRDTDLWYDAGLVDTFLHPSDRAYSVPQILEFVRKNGLKLQSWLDNVQYSLSARIPNEDDPLRQRAQALGREEQWQLLELLWQWPSTHRFLVCHPERAESEYVLNFDGDAWLEYTPSLRPPLDIVVKQELRKTSIAEGPEAAIVSIERFSHQVELDAFGIAALEFLDGTTTIRRILDETADAVGLDSAQHLSAARLFFQQMADWDHFLFAIP